MAARPNPFGEQVPHAARTATDVDHAFAWLDADLGELGVRYGREIGDLALKPQLLGLAPAKQVDVGLAHSNVAFTLAPTGGLGAPARSIPGAAIRPRKRRSAPPPRKVRRGSARTRSLDFLLSRGAYLRIWRSAWPPP